MRAHFIEANVDQVAIVVETHVEVAEEYLAEAVLINIIVNPLNTNEALVVLVLDRVQVALRLNSKLGQPNGQAQGLELIIKFRALLAADQVRPLVVHVLLPLQCLVRVHEADLDLLELGVRHLNVGVGGVQVCRPGRAPLLQLCIPNSHEPHFHGPALIAIVCEG